MQAWTLREAAIVGGVVGLKGVGSGKTVSGLLAPLLFPEVKKAALIIEPKQRQHYRKHYLRLREHFRVSSIVMDETIPGGTVPGTTPLHVISYSVLSRTDNSDMLDRLDPDELILDECHRATGKSAINRRIKNFALKKIIQREERMNRGEPVLRRALFLLDWSGTFENKSVEDSQMLCAFSLGTGSPLPLDPEVSHKWSGVMDVKFRPDRESKTARELQREFGNGEIGNGFDIASLLPGASPEEAIRKGFCKRRIETLGVITASAVDINASIYLEERKVKFIPPAIQEALMKIRVEDLRPDGDVLVERIQQVECARNVACGFYPYWAFPKHPCSCDPNLPAGAPRCDQCTLIENWYAARKAYYKAARAKVLACETWLDSEKNLERAAERYWQDPPYKGELPVWACQEWPAWRDIRNRVEYVERVKWIDDYLAQDAAAWALDNKSRDGRAGIVWFQSVPFGRRVAEIAGLSYHNGGPGGEARLNAETGKKSIVCSIQALGAGTDGLQHKFSDQLIAECPASNSSAQGMEQLLGRLHREGQTADVVNTWVYLHVTELYDALRSSHRQALWAKQMKNTTQKLLLATLGDGIDL